MHTDQIYIARDGKSGMHVLVRILAVDDIGKDYLPIDPDDFNKLMMARDVRSLVLAAREAFFERKDAEREQGKGLGAKAASARDASEKLDGQSQVAPAKDNLEH